MKKSGVNSEKCIGMASSDSEIDKTIRGRPKRAELPDVNIRQARKALIMGELL